MKYSPEDKFILIATWQRHLKNSTSNEQAHVAMQKLFSAVPPPETLNRWLKRSYKSLSWKSFLYHPIWQIWSIPAAILGVLSFVFADIGPAAKRKSIAAAVAQGRLEKVIDDHGLLGSLRAERDDLVNEGYFLYSAYSGERTQDEKEMVDKLGLIRVEVNGVAAGIRNFRESNPEKESIEIVVAAAGRSYVNMGSILSKLVEDWVNYPEYAGMLGKDELVERVGGIQKDLLAHTGSALTLYGAELGASYLLRICNAFELWQLRKIEETKLWNQYSLFRQIQILDAKISQIPLPESEKKSLLALMGAKVRILPQENYSYKSHQDYNLNFIEVAEIRYEGKSDRTLLVLLSLEEQSTGILHEIRLAEVVSGEIPAEIKYEFRGSLGTILVESRE